MTSKTTNKFSPEVRERAVGLVLDHEGDYPSRWTACQSISAKIGCSAHTLLDCVKKTEVDSGKCVGIFTDFAERLKALERENRELRQANEILRKASAYFARLLKLGSSLPSAALATVTTMRSPRPSTGFTRPRSSIGVGLGDPSRRSSSLLSNGSTGSITDA